MAAIKKLAGETLWYGVSSIGAKFLNYLLTPILTYLMADASGVRDYGGYSLLYSWIAVANIIFTYGFETGYFRFCNKQEIDRQSLFQTADAKSFSFEAFIKSNNNIKLTTHGIDLIMEPDNKYALNVDDSENVKFINSSNLNSNIKLKIYNHSGKVIQTIENL